MTDTSDEPFSSDEFTPEQWERIRAHNAEAGSGHRKNIRFGVMMEFEFTLKFTLAAGSSPNMDELVERLGAAGCNDALVGIGQTGRIALDFTREAESAKQAIFSALEQVRRAIPTAKLLEGAGLGGE